MIRELKVRKGLKQEADQPSPDFLAWMSRDGLIFIAPYAAVA
jgi:hypothetical protein